jgi:methyl-accepting chemotaxis protein
MLFGYSRYRRALGEIDAICGRAARGDMSGRVLHLKTYGDLSPTLTAFNRLLDLTDAYIRESSASLSFAAQGKYYRPFLPTGMVGQFRQGAEVINAARKSMESRAGETERLQGEVTGLVEAAAAGDLQCRLAVDGKSGFMRQLAEGINTLVERTGEACLQTARAIGAMARGDLSAHMDGRYEGVFGELQRDTNRTMDTLRDVATQLAQSAESVQAASAEISEGSRDLAARTESQAATLEETAAALQQITATVRQNADSAGAASRLAEAARDTAAAGGDVIGRAMRAMAQIEQSAARIADIMSLIDEIAFQTNLLALNASVEAARAGEAGKGFAVVAQEVRALAQRSASASKDIKTLIGASGQQVAAGAALVNEAGGSLTQIVGAVEKVTVIVAEIATASTEQARGIDEVNVAVANLDQVTQRNSSLVEETSAAANLLAEQAERLGGIVRFFQLARS